MTPDQLAVLRCIAEAAVAERETGCPAEISAAQCIVESDWLKVSPGNNCFGIKATDDHCQYCLTKEYLNGEWTSQKLAFATYPTLDTCFAAHARLLQIGVYASASGHSYGMPSIRLTVLLIKLLAVFGAQRTTTRERVPRARALALEHVARAGLSEHPARYWPSVSAPPDIVPDLRRATRAHPHGRPRTQAGLKPQQQNTGTFSKSGRV